MDIYGRYIKKYRGLFATAVSCVVLEALCDLMLPTLMSRIIDDGVRSGQIGTVVRYGLLMLLITALGSCFAASRNILASRVSQSFGADLRGDIFRKIMNFSEESADRIESGSLITRMTNDANQITQFINGLMRIFVKAPVMCMGSIVLAAVLSPALSPILLAAVAAVTALITVSMKLSYTRFAKVQTALDRVNLTVQEYLLGVRLVKAFGRYDDELGKFDAANSELSKRSEDSQLVIAWFSPLITLTVNTGIVIIVFAGSVLFGNGVVEVGKISALISYMAQILSSLLMITNVFNMFVRTKASTARIRAVMESEEDDGGTDGEIKEDGCELEFRDVTFAYPNGSGIPAVKNLSFRAGKGETVAVIGPTGSGKSTLAWLCLRFYDAGEGSIRINGKDIRTLDRHMLRDRIAIVPQKSALFSGTVAENIAWGAPGASEEEVVSAAKAAQADGFISEMPKKYGSVLGRGGVNLSGGQKQRLSIARALLRKAPVLILDDCTSALDAVTEAKVRRGIAESAGGSGNTVILITQRVSTAMSADRIVVLENGSCAGCGSHSELMASCGTYRQIYDSQIGEDPAGVPV